MLQKILLSSLVFLVTGWEAFAARIELGVQPSNSIITNVSSWSFYDFLALIEAFLLKVVLPLVIIGTALYVAYKLFLAEGNEEENKKAWKAVTYATIGVVSIMIAYAVIAIVQRLSL